MQKAEGIKFTAKKYIDLKSRVLKSYNRVHNLISESFKFNTI